MVRFGDHVRPKRSKLPPTLGGVFESLDRRGSHTDLRPIQQEVLSALSKRLEDRDVVLKLSTGSGKTLLGLVYLYAKMRDLEEPAVYLCSTKQLVRQVIKEAGSIGIEAVEYPGGARYPPQAGISARAVLVCTYDKLFNGKSTFNRDDVDLVPGAVVLDDAHAGLERIVQAFTCTVSAQDEYDSLIALLAPSCEAQFGPKWTDTVAGDPSALLEVPWWIWKEVASGAAPVLSKSAPFAWPLLRDSLRWCRCVVGAGVVEVAPRVLPISRCAAFDRAKHRLFMSATLTDDSALVRDLGCSPTAVEASIRPDSDRGLGERMVIAPSLIDSSLDFEWLGQQCKELSRISSVVVLCSSLADAKAWEQHGARAVAGDDVAAEVESLRTLANGEGSFVALAQRYDGIDLPDDACRVLVLDGLPEGEGLIQKYDSGISNHVRRRLAQRIEQGMGRAVRSYVDYAVVILVGHALTCFVSRKDSLALMSPETRAQLALASELADLASQESGSPAEAVAGMIGQCLQRDAEWKKFHQSRVRQTERVASADGALEIRIATSDRRAEDHAIAKNASAAADELQALLNNVVLDDDRRGLYLQALANYLSDTDPGGALGVQRKACEANTNIAPPPAEEKRPRDAATTRPEALIKQWLAEFQNANGALAEISGLRTRTGFNIPSNEFERALDDLGRCLGAEASRPEKQFGKGPDNLWEWPDATLVIEAKTGNLDGLHKKDGGQLFQSVAWYAKAKPTRSNVVPIVVTDATDVDANAEFPEGTRILTSEGLRRLFGKLEAFLRQVIADGESSTDVKKIRAARANHGLLVDRLISDCTIPVSPGASAIRKRR